MRWRVIALSTVMSLFLAIGVVADTTTTTSSFSLNINEVVHIQLVPTDIGSITTHRHDLLQQYLYIGTIDVRVYTISNYDIWFSKMTAQTLVAGGTTTALETIRDQLMELKVVELGGADDGTANPTLQYSEAVNWSDIPDTTVKLLFSGGNTEGGALNYQYARVAFRFDLAALCNNASGNIYDFTIRLTITDPTT